MIYTRFGSEVDIIDYEPGVQQLKIRYREKPHDTTWVEILQLKADGGIKEICDAARDCRQTKKAGIEYSKKGYWIKFNDGTAYENFTDSNTAYYETEEDAQIVLDAVIAAGIDKRVK